VLDSNYVDIYTEVEIYLEGLKAACQSSYLTADGLDYIAGDFLNSEWLSKLMASDTAVRFLYDTLLNDGTVDRDAVRRIVSKGNDMSDLEWRALQLLLEDGRCSYEDILFIFQTHEYVTGTNPFTGEYYEGTIVVGQAPKVRETIDRLSNTYSRKTESYANQLLSSGILMNEHTGSDEYEHLKRLMELGQLFTFLGDCPDICPTDFDLSTFTHSDNGKIVYKNEVYEKSDVDQLFSPGVKYATDLYDILNRSELADPEQLTDDMLLIVAEYGIGKIPGSDEVMLVLDSTRTLSDYLNEKNWTTEQQVSARYSFANANRLLGGGEAYVQTPASTLPKHIAATTTPNAVISYASLIDGFENINSPEDALRILLDPSEENRAQGQELTRFLTRTGGGRDAYMDRLYVEHESVYGHARMVSTLPFDELYDLIERVNNE
jgi:hypothetical protein